MWFWLGLALAAHVAGLVGVITLVLQGRNESIGFAAVAAALAVGATMLGAWLERREPMRKRPARWASRAFGVVWLQSVAIGLASGDIAPEWSLRIIAAVGFAVVQLGCVVMAARAVRCPLTPELGEMDLEVTAKIRCDRPGMPAWSLPDEVRLTSQEIIAVLHPSPASVFAVSIALAEVTEVLVRPARPQDSPWVRLDDGRDYFISAGDVMEIRHSRGATVMPVLDATAFADVIRRRIAIRSEKATG